MLNIIERGALMKHALWFVGLWFAGVAAAFLLALPFRVLVGLAMR
ncbi:hypothetical protein VSR82_38660 [Burkholderia sp. JPY481]